MKLLLVPFFLTAVLCNNLPVENVDGDENICDTDACISIVARLKASMDTSVKPCDNFYKFACGSYVKNAPLQEDESETDVLNELYKRIQDQLKGVLEEGVIKGEPPHYRFLKHLYSLCMDDKKGPLNLKTFKSLLKKAGGWPVLGNWNEEKWDLLKTEINLVKLQLGSGALFSVDVNVDLKDNKKRVIEIDQPGLIIPREYLILGEDDDIVKAYFSYMVDIAVMLGANEQTARDELIESLQFQIKMAEKTNPHVGVVNFEDLHHPYQISQLTKDFGWFDWKRLLQDTMPKTVPLKVDELIIVNEVQYLNDLDVLIKKTSPKVIANTVMWNTVHMWTEYLTSEIRDRRDKFMQVLGGTTARSPRWKECYVEMTLRLPVALSSIYVKNFFDENSKKGAIVMMEGFRQAMLEKLKKVDWMDDETREQAKAKAANIIEHIGYPDELLDNGKMAEYYKGLKLDQKNYVQALLAYNKWEHERDFRMLREPVNKKDWTNFAIVAVADGSYDFTENAMQFPAGILHEPFFSYQLPKYVTHATLGTLFGYGLTQSIYNEGSEFDSEGKLNPWWSSGTKENFKEIEQCYKNQYSGFKCSQTNLKVDGARTQTNNVADNGGAAVAYQAYVTAITGQTDEEAKLPGFTDYTPQKLFWLSMANISCSRFRDEALKRLIQTGIHAPPEFRVNGVFMNLPEFNKDFGCDVGTPMNSQKKRCTVW